MKQKHLNVSSGITVLQGDEDVKNEQLYLVRKNLRNRNGGLIAGTTNQRELSMLRAYVSEKIAQDHVC